MKKNAQIALTIVIDRKYLEPCLVTIYDVWRFKDLFKNIYIFYIEDDIKKDQNFLNIIANFKNALDSTDFIKIIKINNTLPKFDILHFSNSLLYKILIPTVLNGESYILNIDAGIIFGSGFLSFINSLNEKINSHINFIIGAFIEESKGLMPVKIIKCSNYYPSAALLLFDVKNYLVNKVNERIINFFYEQYMNLVYAEQEILSGVLNDNDFYPFPFQELVYLDDLANYASKNYSPIDNERLEKCVYYKNPGSIKPWKLWNLNPNKSIYLEIRNLVNNVINIDSSPEINYERTSIQNHLEPIRTAHLMKYEENLLTQKLSEN